MSTLFQQLIKFNRDDLRQKPVYQHHQYEVQARDAAFAEEDTELAAIALKATPAVVPKAEKYVPPYRKTEQIACPGPVKQETIPTAGEAPAKTKRFSPSALRYKAQRITKRREDKAKKRDWRAKKLQNTHKVVDKAPSSHKALLKANLKKIDSALSNLIPFIYDDKPTPKSVRLPKPLWKPQKGTSKLDIAEISSLGFHFNAHRPDNEVFLCTLAEINKAINWKFQEEKAAKDAEEPEESYEELLERLLPEVFKPYKGAFSKQEANTVPESQPGVDYKIHLEKEINYGYSGLYNQSTKELKIMKKYLEENLDKGFIVLS